MVKAIWVEDINSPVERTEVLRKEIEKVGFRLSTKEFIPLLRKNKLNSHTIASIEDRNVTIIGARYDCPYMMAYGTMRIEEEYGFYISCMKLKESGFPEVRLIIDNKVEFETWFQGFIRELQQYGKGPSVTLPGT